VHKVRQALSDSAENPRYIETVPGRGYRFIGNVKSCSATRDPESVRPEAPVGGTGNAATEAPANIARRWKMIIPGAAAAVLVSLGAGYFFFHRAPKLTDKDTMVLADFTNTTGDPVFDGTLRQGLVVQLEQSPFLSLIPEERIHRMMPLMGQPVDGRVTPDLARQVYERTASAAVLEGSISLLGSQYVVGLRAKSCRSGDVLDEEQVQAARKEDVLNALSQIASTFRTRVGESLATVEKHQTPLAEATTPSLEALKAYSAASKAAYTTGSATAVPLLQRAIEIDPKFAAAHAYLSRVYGDLGESVASSQSASRAYQLRDRAGDQERCRITMTYLQQVTGNLEKAKETGESCAQIYPRDISSYGLLSGMIYQGLGDYDRSIRAAETAIELDPDFTFGYVNLAFTYFYLDRLGEAEGTIQRAFRRNLEIPELLVLRYHIAFLTGRKEDMEAAADRARGNPEAEEWMLHSEALTLARSGQLRLARQMSGRAVDLAQQLGRKGERRAIRRHPPYGKLSLRMQPPQGRARRERLRFHGAETWSTQPPWHLH
jgi:eukaryotic-like serine/threonine-protein kinase